MTRSLSSWPWDGPLLGRRWSASHIPRDLTWLNEVQCEAPRRLANPLIRSLSVITRVAVAAMGTKIIECLSSKSKVARTWLRVKQIDKPYCLCIRPSRGRPYVHRQARCVP
jgi:hypothetical protein